MTFQFRPAVRDKTSLLIALAGASGSGKTYSALTLATGLAGKEGKVAMIDTEAGRGLHYAEQFTFDHTDITPPFRPNKYTDAIKAADEAGYDVIVIDSMSHEYDGEGGIMEWADEFEAKGAKGPAKWKEPKMAHKKMMQRMLQVRAHLIFCLRAEEKIKIEPNPNGRGTIVVPAGWQPICEKRFMFEMTASFILTDDAPGVPQAIKLQDQHKFAFPDGKQISVEAGTALSQWAHGNKPAAKAEKKEPEPVADEPDLPAEEPEYDPDLRVIASDIVTEIKRSESYGEVRKVLAKYGMTDEGPTGQIAEIRDGDPKAYDEIRKAAKGK